MTGHVIGSREFVDGTCRPICEDAQGQYVLDDDGKQVYGLWLMPEESCDPPLIVDGHRHAEG